MLHRNIHMKPGCEGVTMASLGETVAALAAHRWTSKADADANAVALTEATGFGANPGALRMLAHVPEDLPTRAPLVVVLHGCTQTAAAYARGAGWIEMADRCGFILLCPEQIRANNANLCFNWFQAGDVTRGAGEAASIHAMVRHAIGAYDADPARVFVTGLSAGGAMANVMLATYPESFAGGAIIAGLPYGVASSMQQAFAAMRHARSSSPRALGEAVRRASPHRGPWPRVSIWQGDEDATVKAGVADDLVRQWREVHGVQNAAAESGGSGRRRDTVWRDARSEAVVELHRLAGMGHGTPLGCDLADGCGTAGPYLLEVGVSSTLEIARSWGLVGTASPRAAQRPAPSAPPRSNTWAPADAAGAPPLRAAVSEIGGVISEALRNAGLLR